MNTVEYYEGELESFRSLPLTNSVDLLNDIIIDPNQDATFYNNIKTEHNLLENTINSDYLSLSTELDDDINTMILNGQGVNNSIKIKQNEQDNDMNDLINTNDKRRGTHELYKDARRKYHIDRQINALLFFAVLLLFSFVNINISYALFSIMVLYISLTTLSVAVDISPILTGLIIITLLYIVYYIRSKVSSVLGKSYTKL